MPEFLVETYVPRNSADAVERAGDRARQATTTLADEGVAIRFVRSIYVPEDETCFFLFDADTVELVHAAVGLAELRVDRVTEAVGAAEIARPQE